MKQHITVEQLNELSKEEISLLEDIINKNPITKKVPLKKYQWNVSSININIGWMIEFLEDNWNDWYMDYQDTTCYWSVKLGYLPNIEEPRLSYGNEELADALWEAVKDILT